MQKAKGRMVPPTGKMQEFYQEVRWEKGDNSRIKTGKYPKLTVAQSSTVRN